MVGLPFPLGCPTNDILLSESSDGVAWDAPYRVPLDLILGARDHMYPGLGVDPNSAGTSVRIGVTYYFYGNAACTLAKPVPFDVAMYYPIGALPVVGGNVLPI